MAHHSQAGYSSSRECYKTVYKEEYIPGTRDNPGYIKLITRQWLFLVLMIGHMFREKQQLNMITNDCSDGKLAGALLGGGAAAAMSRGDGRWWAIPLGVVTGSAIGCDLDGG